LPFYVSCVNLASRGVLPTGLLVERVSVFQKTQNWLTSGSRVAHEWLTNGSLTHTLTQSQLQSVTVAITTASSPLRATPS
jgi:hypothetical protein